MESRTAPRARRSVGFLTLALAVLSVAGLQPLQSQEGGVLAELCAGRPNCVDDALDVVFDSGTSTYTGALVIGTEIPIGIVMDARSEGIEGFTYGVAHDSDFLTLIPESVTTDGTIFDPGEPGNIGPAFYLLARAVQGGFIGVAILPLVDRVDMPAGRHVVSRATYRVAARPECSVIRIVHNRLGASGGTVSVGVVVSVNSRSRTPRALRQGVVGSGPCGETCDDLADNDGDGLIDCNDPDCAGSESCGEEICNDALDNDRDWRIDCGDADCAGILDCPEAAGCGDGVDNDLDGLVDCADPDCAAKAPCIEECDDGIDNDGDGFVDRLDLDCADRLPLIHGDAPAAASFVRGDANGDGRIDVLDAVVLVRFVSGEERGRDCLEALNTNGDGGIDSSDSLPLLRWIFLYGPPLPSPFPDCGEAPGGACSRTTPGC